MVNEDGSSDFADPFHNYSTFSLFPRTFRVSTDHHQNTSDDDTSNIDSIHSRLKSMALRTPKKLLEQAKAVVDGGSKLMNSNLTSRVPSEENKNEDVAADAGKVEGNLRKRRPGLGLKRERARFDFKADLSQFTLSSETSLDMDKVAMEIEKLQDPEEYFLAHKRLEMAKKEIQRQMGGVSTDVNERDPPAAAQPRQRRPGLFGFRRRTGRFKELYSQMRSENDETFLSSQDISEQEIPSPSNNSSQQENNVPNVILSERECAGPISTTEDKVNELFDELLSKNPEDLEGDRAITLLQERLQIKPIVLDKLCLPDLHDIPKFDFKVSGGNLLKPRNSLSDIRAKLKGVSSQTPAKQIREAESSFDPIASPSPPKSPFAAISLLKRRMSQSNRSHDPFLALDKDLSPDRNPSVGSIDKHSDQVEMEKDLRTSEILKSLHEDDSTTVGNMASCEVTADDSTRPVHKYVNEFSSALGVGMDVHPNGLHGEFGANAGASNGDEMIIDDESISRDTHSNAPTNTPNNFEDSAGDMLQEAVASAQPDINNEDISLEDLNNSLRKSDQPSSASVEDIAMDGRSEDPDAGPEQHIEKIQDCSRTLFDQSPGKRPPRQKLNVPSKATKRPCKEPKRKENSRRQSLAAAGMKWESGVRRSTRIKMRPLKYWKGERFLYGRIHQSLATVIGVKYASPAKGDGEPSLKVKSYVSDKYKELVDLAALH